MNEFLKVKRVQKYIETLDMLKVRNSGLGKAQLQQQQIYRGSNPKTFHKQQELKRNANFNPGAVVVTTKWETF